MAEVFFATLNDLLATLATSKVACMLGRQNFEWVMPSSCRSCWIFKFIVLNGVKCQINACLQCMQSNAHVASYWYMKIIDPAACDKLQSDTPSVHGKTLLTNLYGAYSACSNQRC